MSARLVLDFSEIREGLRQLHDSVSGTGEAAHIVEAHANSAAVTIRSGYPSRTGDLRDKLTVEHRRSAFGARSVVRNTSTHALPFEVGTQARHTSLGANRGSMPPNPIFTQTIRRERRAMFEDFRTLLTRAGLIVTGEP